MTLPDGLVPGAGDALCAVADVDDGGVRVVEARVDGDVESLLLLRRGDVVRAFYNVCPHAGRRLDWAPERVLVSNGQVICASHGAAFAIPGGECVAGPCRGQSLREVPVRVEDGQVRLAADA